MELEIIDDKSQRPVMYNYFFNPNVCHVCKRRGQRRLTPCVGCHMISYCSDEHRLLHREQHEEICQAIKNIRKYKNIWDTRHMTLEQWVQSKKENLQLIKNMLGRELEPYEQQMFLFAKSCMTCRQQQPLVSICSYCETANKCTDHLSTQNAHSCVEMQQCFFYDFYYTVINEQMKRIPEQLLNVKIRTIDNMQSFIHNSLHRNHDEYSCSFSFDDYIYSDKLSGPLTLFYGMQDANLLDFMSIREYFIVHIITGTFLDLYSLSAWEFILHKFYPGTTLLIVTIKPSLSEKCEFLRVCQDCTGQEKKIQYDCLPLSYYKYACMMHTRPDVIILFDAEFEHDVISRENIRAFQNENCPILLTTKSEIKANEIIMKIQDVLGLPFTPIINKQNKFKSYRPYRDYENDAAYLPNQHLVIYRNLSRLNNPT